MYLQTFFAINVAITFTRVGFFPTHVALQTATSIAIAFALEVARVIAIKFRHLIEHGS